MSDANMSVSAAAQTPENASIANSGYSSEPWTSALAELDVNQLRLDFRNEAQALDSLHAMLPKVAKASFEHAVQVVNLFRARVLLRLRCGCSTQDVEFEYARCIHSLIRATGRSEYDFSIDSLPQEDKLSIVEMARNIARHLTSI